MSFGAYRPIILEDLLADQRLLFVRTDGDEDDFDSEKLFDAGDVGLALLREVIIVPASGDIFLPALHRLEDGLHLVHGGNAARHIIDLLAVERISDADLDLLD